MRGQNTTSLFLPHAPGTCGSNAPAPHGPPLTAAVEMVFVIWAKCAALAFGPDGVRHLRKGASLMFGPDGVRYLRKGASLTFGRLALRFARCGATSATETIREAEASPTNPTQRHPPCRCHASGAVRGEPPGAGDFEPRGRRACGKKMDGRVLTVHFFCPHAPDPHVSRRWSPRQAAHPAACHHEQYRPPQRATTNSTGPRSVPPRTVQAPAACHHEQYRPPRRATTTSKGPPHRATTNSAGPPLRHGQTYARRATTRCCRSPPSTRGAAC